MKRRFGLRSVLAGLLLSSALAGPAAAQPGCDPGPVPEILSTMRDLAGQPDADARRTAITSLIDRWAAGRSIAQTILHTRWAGLSAADQTRLAGLLGQLTAVRAAATLARDGINEYAMLGTRPIAGGDCLVTSRLVDGRGRARILHWRMRKSPQGQRFVDLLVDGISLTRNLRDEVDAILRDNGSNVADLEARLRTTIARIRRSNR